MVPNSLYEVVAAMAYHETMRKEQVKKKHFRKLIMVILVTLTKHQPGSELRQAGAEWISAYAAYNHLLAVTGWPRPRGHLPIGLGCGACD